MHIIILFKNCLSCVTDLSFFFSSNMGESESQTLMSLSSFLCVVKSFHLGMMLGIAMSQSVTSCLSPSSPRYTAFCSIWVVRITSISTTSSNSSALRCFSGSGTPFINTCRSEDRRGGDERCVWCFTLSSKLG